LSGGELFPDAFDRGTGIRAVEGSADPPQEGVGAVIGSQRRGVAGRDLLDVCPSECSGSLWAWAGIVAADTAAITSAARSFFMRINLIREERDDDKTRSERWTDQLLGMVIRRGLRCVEGA
jgi:hypothetical protein